MYQLWCLDYLSMVQNSGHQQKLSVAGLIVTLGIIYGDIGTSPLYVFKSIIKDGDFLRPGECPSAGKSTRKSLASTKECLFDIEQAALANDDIREMIHRLANICRDL